MKPSTLNLFEYTDYRAFLKDRLEELKNGDGRYSYRFLANRLGLSSKSHLKMVVDGSRHLSEPLASKLADLLCLNARETDFFMELVRFAKARNDRQKREILARLRRKSRFLDVHRVELERLDYLNDDLTLTLREMAALKDFSEDPQWIASRYRGRAGKKKIEQALERLLEMGLLARNETGKLEAVHAHQDVSGDIANVALRSFYKRMFQKASASLEISREERHLGGYTMTLSQDAYVQVTEILQDAVTKIRRVVDEDDAPENVYQMVFALFPLTRSNGDGGED